MTEHATVAFRFALCDLRGLKSQYEEDHQAQNEAQAQAMHAESLHDRILHRAEDLYTRLVRAYHGDEGAREALLADDSLPDELKDDLRMSSVTSDMCRK